MEKTKVIELVKGQFNNSKIINELIDKNTKLVNTLMEQEFQKTLKEESDILDAEANALDVKLKAFNDKVEALEKSIKEPLDLEINTLDKKLSKELISSLDLGINHSDIIKLSGGTIENHKENKELNLNFLIVTLRIDGLYSYKLFTVNSDMTECIGSKEGDLTDFNKSGEILNGIKELIGLMSGKNCLTEEEYKELIGEKILESFEDTEIKEALYSSIKRTIDRIIQGENYACLLHSKSIQDDSKTNTEVVESVSDKQQES